MTAIVGGGIFIVSFLIGRSFGTYEKGIVVEELIKLLCEQGYLKYRHLPDGEIELIKLNDS